MTEYNEVLPGQLWASKGGGDLRIRINASDNRYAEVYSFHADSSASGRISRILIDQIPKRYTLVTDAGRAVLDVHRDQED